VVLGDDDRRAPLALPPTPTSRLAGGRRDPRSRPAIGRVARRSEPHGEHVVSPSVGNGEYDADLRCGFVAKISYPAHLANLATVDPRSSGSHVRRPAPHPSRARGARPTGWRETSRRGASVRATMVTIAFGETPSTGFVAGRGLLEDRRGPATRVGPPGPRARARGDRRARRSEGRDRHRAPAPFADRGLPPRRVSLPCHPSTTARCPNAVVTGMEGADVRRLNGSARSSSSPVDAALVDPELPSPLLFAPDGAFRHARPAVPQRSDRLVLPARCSTATTSSCSRASTRRRRSRRSPGTAPRSCTSCPR